MRNEKLITAREERRWTQEKAAEKVGVSRVAYARWEEKGIIPHLSTINMVCNAFKMTPESLGFREPVNIPVRISSGIQLSTTAIGNANMLSIGVLALSLAQRQYSWTFEDLRARTEQEMRRLEMEQRKYKDGDVSRRQALSFLAGLPVAFLGFSQANTETALPAEEVLPLYISSVPACWKLFFEGELAEVEKLIPTYITHLTPLAQQFSKYQKPAANLLSQAHQLGSLLVLQHEDFGSSLAHCKQGCFYGAISGEPDIQAGALIQQVNTLYYRKRHSQVRTTIHEATQFATSASPVMRGRIYSELGAVEARWGNVKDAHRYMGMSHDTFPEYPEDDPSYLYTYTNGFILYLNDSLAYLYLKQPKDAWGAITQAASFVPDTTSHRYIELLYHQTRTSVALGDLEQSRTYFETTVVAGKASSLDLYLSDMSDIHQQMIEKWPHEQRVIELADLLNG